MASPESSEYTMTHQLVIDGDAHLVEPPHIWRDYIDPHQRDEVEFECDPVGNVDRVLVGGEQFIDLRNLSRPWGWGDTFTPGGLRDGPRDLRLEESAAGGWDPVARLQVHDENGIDAAVLFPSLGMLAGLVADRELSLALCRAVNRWVADYIHESPYELYAVASLPWQWPEDAADELRRCVADAGFIAGHVMPLPAFDGRRLSDPTLDVLWGTAVDLDVPMCCHTGNSSRSAQVGSDRVSSWMVRHACVHPLEAMLAFGALYEEGVFDRFADLRVGFMEASCGWIPFWLERLDEHFEMMRWSMRDDARRPSQVFVEQCVVGCEGDEAQVPQVQKCVGLDRLMWSSDFPHFDTSPPFVAGVIARDDMSPEQLRGFMQHAAAQFYGLDTQAIARARLKRSSNVE